MCWEGTHEAAQHTLLIAGCGEETLVGHARYFASLLAASEPCIQDPEPIVGAGLVTPAEGSQFSLGHYDPHYPPNYARLLRWGLPGIRDRAQARAVQERDPERRAFLDAAAISYEAACAWVRGHARHAPELAAHKRDPQRRAELAQIAAVCDELASAPPPPRSARRCSSCSLRASSGRPGASGVLISGSTPSTSGT